MNQGAHSSTSGSSTVATKRVPGHTIRRNGLGKKPTSSTTTVSSTPTTVPTTTAESTTTTSIPSATLLSELYTWATANSQAQSSAFVGQHSDFEDYLNAQRSSSAIISDLKELVNSNCPSMKTAADLAALLSMLEVLPSMNPTVPSSSSLPPWVLEANTVENDPGVWNFIEGFWAQLPPGSS